MQYKEKGKMVGWQKENLDMHSLLARHALSVHYIVLPEATNNTVPAIHWVG